MTMSTDCVEFKLNARVFTGSANGTLTREGNNAARLVMTKTLGLTNIEAETILHAKRDEDFTIYCRPSQFARFLIMRNQAGFKNEFQILQPRLMQRFALQPLIIDTTQRPKKEE